MSGTHLPSSGQQNPEWIPYVLAEITLPGGTHVFYDCEGGFFLSLLVSCREPDGDTGVRLFYLWLDGHWGWSIMAEWPSFLISGTADRYGLALAINLNLIDNSRKNRL
ncbi:hypothetical protein AVEN_141386-1 [Araneus ventricosus]|uniref:Uncharacterized protein n=1 Tax=Araneus ventricosus TaxID=182803 RepID=A0A4Y2CYB4_ARAVE|nr:hypothetical protein AVEN_141386-1 [Araneus ventricosus]